VQKSFSATIGEIDRNREEYDISYAMKQEPVPVFPCLWKGMKDQELAVWYNDHVIYPDKV
jgi:hypothetical protein